MLARCGRLVEPPEQGGKWRLLNIYQSLAPEDIQPG